MTADSLREYRLDPIVITAARGERSIHDVPVPVDVILQDEMVRRAAVRLTDLLAEQADFTVVHEFGAAIQMQGLGSDYVLILIDGEPLVGRSGGTLDLDRLSLSAVDRVEIVRGPSSSLYGSDALAGVINIITASPDDEASATASAYLETHNTSNLSVTGDFSSKRVRGSLTLDRYASDGYDPYPNTPGQAVPGFEDNSGNVKFDIRVSGTTRLKASGRFSRLDQKNEIGLSFGPGGPPIASIGERTDWSAGGSLDRTIGSRMNASASLHSSRFVSTTSLDFPGVSEADDSKFKQDYTEGELKITAVPTRDHAVTGGAGVVHEIVRADRVVDGRQATGSLFGYAQHEWKISDRFELTSGARVDAHPDYQDRISPKASVLLRPTKTVSVRASVGSGFKAPTFQQRYLDFDNPIGGYSVLGAADLQDELASLVEAGVVRLFVDESFLGAELRPEHSWSVNTGADWYGSHGATVKVNLFYNLVSDLIETILVGERTSGQQIFSYENLDHIRTAGVEAKARMRVMRRTTLDLGYQFVDAVDLDVLERVREGTVYRRDNGRDRLVTPGEYGGLFQRSRHAGSLQLTRELDRYGIVVSVRGTIRSRFGLVDRNGNLILDDASEYVPGYSLWNATVTKSVTSRATVQFGVKNVFDHTDAARVPSIPGRLIFGAVRLTTRQ